MTNATAEQLYQVFPPANLFSRIGGRAGGGCQWHLQLDGGRNRLKVPQWVISPRRKPSLPGKRQRPFEPQTGASGHTYAFSNKTHYETLPRVLQSGIEVDGCNRLAQPGLRADSATFPGYVLQRTASLVDLIVDTIEMSTQR